MFSFVIIDRQLGKIFAATDRFGIKPNYYGFIKNKKCFFITSNFSSLVKTKIIPKKINSGVLQEFVSYGQIYNNSTIIDNVYDFGYLCKRLPGLLKR